jgi:hypothetical protein
LQLRHAALCVTMCATLSKQALKQVASCHKLHCHL